MISTALLAIVVAGAPKKETGPQPAAVEAAPGKAPSDAVVLFDGKDLSNWMGSEGQSPEWAVEDGILLCRTGAGDLHSRVKFRSAQIHVEFNVPSMPEQSGQKRGNSGVLLHSRGNEVQILDSYQNPTYADGACGAFYGVAPPLVNASRRPGEWQSYDIVYHAPRCGAGGQVRTPGSLTVLHNGVLVQDHVPAAPRGGCLEEGPLILQDHNGFQGKRVPPGAKMTAPITRMRFRNVWLRRLAD
ncbi:MAG: DUF1080 domain-containing protein [Bryobacteraceae bacterium]